MNEANTFSPFATVLAKLLKAQFNQRDQWARVLHVSESAISQWVRDKTVPRADLLHMIYHLVESGPQPPTEDLAEFRRIANQPSADVSPLGSRMGRTIWAYMTGDVFTDLTQRLRGLSIAEQRKVLQGEVGAEFPPNIESTDTTSVSPSESEPRITIAEVHSENVPCIIESSLPNVKWFDWSADKIPFGSEFIEPAFTTSTRSSSEPIDWISICEKTPALIVGAPGSGKSTVARHLAWRFGRSSETSASIFINASGFWKFAHDVASPENLLAKFGDYGRARVYFIIDGIDELSPEVRGKATSLIARFPEAAPQVQPIITSRPVLHSSACRPFKRLILEPFSSLQTNAWIYRRLSAHRHLSKAAISRFCCHFHETPSFNKVRRNPLFLSFATSEFIRSDITAFDEATLLQCYIRGLLGDWDRHKRISRVRQPWASTRNLIAALSNLCYRLTVGGKSEFTSNELSSWLKQDCLNAPADELLRLLHEATALIEKKSSNTWRINDPRLQAFLAALFVVESPEEASKLIDQIADERMLGEVFRYACSLASDATSLLQHIAKKQSKSVDNHWLMAAALAQPLVANPKQIRESCELVVHQLDTSCSKWDETKVRDTDIDVSALWYSRFRLPQSAKIQVDRVGDTLGMIHKARSGPAKESFAKELRKAHSSSIRRFGESLQVEGQFKHELCVDGSEVFMDVKVIEPQSA